MNLAAHYFVNRSVIVLLERYYANGYRTLAEFRSSVIRDYRFESIRLREIPGKNKMDSWELRISGKTYFFNYEHKNKTFKYVGVR